MAKSNINRSIQGQYRLPFRFPNPSKDRMGIPPLPTRNKGTAGSREKGQEHYSANKPDLISDDLLDIAEERCRVWVPDHRRSNAKFGTIHGYYRMCTPDEIRNYAWSHDQQRTDIIRDVTDKISRAVEDPYKDNVTPASLQERVTQGFWEGISQFGGKIPYYHLYKFWKATAEAYMLAYLGTPNPEVANVESGFYDIYYYLAGQPNGVKKADALVIWLGHDRALELFLNSPIDLVEWMDDPSGPRFESPKDEQWFKRKLQKNRYTPSQQPEAVQLAREYKITPQKYDSVISLFDALLSKKIRTEIDEPIFSGNRALAIDEEDIPF